jgi:hypothetical protein
MPPIKRIQTSRTNAALFKGPSHARGNKSLHRDDVRLFPELPPSQRILHTTFLDPNQHPTRDVLPDFSNSLTLHALCWLAGKTKSRKIRHTARPQEQIEKKGPKISELCRCASNPTRSRAHSTRRAPTFQQLAHVACVVRGYWRERLARRNSIRRPTFRAVFSCSPKTA